MTRPTSPFAYPAYRNLWFSRSVSMLGTGLVSIAMVFAVLQIGGGPADIGIVLAARILPTGVMLLFGGVFADRLNRRTLMVSADTARALVQATAGILLLTGSATVLSLALLNVLFGVATAFFNPSATGILPHTVPREVLQKANGMIVLTTGVTDIVSPVVSATALALASPGVVFLADAATFALSALALSRMRIAQAQARGDRPTFGRDILAGWRLVSGTRWLWAGILTGSGYFMLVVAPLYVLGPVISTTRFDGPWSWAAIAAALSAGILIGAVSSMAVPTRRPLLIGTTGLLLQAVPSALLALGADLPLVLGAQVLGGIGIGYFATIWDTLLQSQVPEGSRSKVGAYDWAGNLVAMPIGLALAGPVADLIGVESVFWLAAAFALVLIVPLLFLVEFRTLNTESPPLPEAEALLEQAERSHA